MYNFIADFMQYIGYKDLVSVINSMRLTMILLRKKSRLVANINKKRKLN